MIVDPEEIGQIQLVLRAAGFPVEVTGVYDPATTQAVRDWQARLGMANTGEWNEATTAATINAFQDVGSGRPLMVPPQPQIGMDLERWELQRKWEQLNNQAPDVWPDSGELDGFAFLRQTLRGLGLGGLQGWAIQQLQLDRSPEEIMILLEDTPEFQARFPAYKELQAKGQAMSPQQMLEYEDTAREIMRSSGFPPTFYDGPEDFAALMLADWSPMELQRRVEESFRKVIDSHPSVRDYMRSEFGIHGDVALAMTFLDPKRAEPALTRMVEEAKVGASAKRLDFAVSRGLVEELVRTGVTESQSIQLFSELNQRRELLSETAGESDDLTAEQAVREQTGLASGNRLQQRLQRRVALGSGSGGPIGLEAGLGAGRANE